MLDTPVKILEAMPGTFQPHKAGPINLVVQFDLTGEQGGEWAVLIANGACRVETGRVDKPVATISLSDQDFVKIFTGQLNAVAAYMSGRVQVAGDVTAIMNILTFFELS